MTCEESIFVMSSKVETFLAHSRTGSKRFLDFARNDKMVTREIERCYD
jgi:hypothetical protein